ncbi:MAG: inner membrane CreD family protein, partial [Pyrinomonadaceae bacterium]
MTKRIIAIAFIFVCTSIAWLILGGTIFTRTYSSNSVSENRVASTWGAPQDQKPPTASFTRIVPKSQETTVNGKKTVTTVNEEITMPLPLEASGINVWLDLQHRQKGLLWYRTYKVNFSGVYTFRNTSEKEETVDFTWHFPASQAMYDDLTFTVDGVAVPVANHHNASMAKVKVNPGRIAQLAVGYRSQALDEWRYSFGSDVTQVRDFNLNMKTNFKDIDFPD